MLTGFKVSSLAYKCAFYRPEHNENGKPNETEFSRSWYSEMKNIPIDKLKE